MKDSNKGPKKKIAGRTFILFVSMEVVLIVLYAFCTEYSTDLAISSTGDSSADTLKYYPFF